MAPPLASSLPFYLFFFKRDSLTVAEIVEPISTVFVKEGNWFDTTFRLYALSNIKWAKSKEN